MLRSDILEYLNNMTEIQWPPCFEKFGTEENFPASLVQFLEHHIKPPSRELTENVKRIVNSFASDFIEAIGNKKVTTAKHFILALGLHNMEGQRKVIQILNKLGHCMSYDLSCEIETS